MVFSAFTWLRNHQYELIPEHFHHFQTLYSLAVTLHSPSCQLLENINSLAASRDLSILDISYKWNHTVYSLLDQLCSFGLTSSKFICVLQCINTLFLFIYSVDISITFCLSINQLIGNWVASIFWLSWIMLLWTWVCRYFFEILLSILFFFNLKNLNNFLAALHSTRDLSSPTRDQTHALCSGSMEF